MRQFLFRYHLFWLRENIKKSATIAAGGNSNFSIAEDVVAAALPYRLPILRLAVRVNEIAALSMGPGSPGWRKPLNSTAQPRPSAHSGRPAEPVALPAGEELHEAPCSAAGAPANSAGGALGPANLA